jgi:hypothetical protein
VSNTNNGSGTRTVKRVRRLKRIVPASQPNPGSDLLEQVSVSEVEKEIEILRATGCDPAVQTPQPGVVKAFVSRHYSNGRYAAQVVRSWLPYVLAIAALSAAGFLEGLVTAAAFGVATLVVLTVGFVSGLVSRWRKTPHTVPAEKAPSE